MEHGKSTIFRMILGLIDKSSGNIEFNGKSINNKVLDRFGYLPEEGSLPLNYSVIDACEYYGSLKLMDKNDISQSLLKWLKEFNLESYIDTKLKKLSKGNRQKVQFIVSVLHDPEFVILDEPFSGLDPVSVAELEEKIFKLKEEGKTIIFSSHVMTHVEKLCDDILLIDKGKVLLYDELEKVIANYEINGQKVNSLTEIFIDKVGELDE